MKLIIGVLRLLIAGAFPSLMTGFSRMTLTALCQRFGSNQRMPHLRRPNGYALRGKTRKIAAWMMQHIVLISCVSRKAPSRAKCRDLYLSDLFRKSLRYAHSLSPDKVFVLSAKYGLVGLDQEIAPYNETLNDKSIALVKEWAADVRDQIAQVADLANDRFTFLAGIRYRRFLAPLMSHHHVPMRGLSIGRQLQFLKENAT